MAYACLFVPDFPVQAVMRLEPSLKGTPVAIYEGAPPLTKVFAANAAAKALGVEKGMTRLQAEAWSGVAWRWRSLAQEASAHAALLDCAWAISPRVEDFFKADDEELPDTVVLDIAGCGKLFGTAEQIAGTLKRVATELGLDANVAVAENPQAAVCAARGFAGVTIIPQGEEGLRLGPLPLSSLRVPLEFQETLQRWGIHTCAEFAALPEIAVVERFGQEGRRWQLRARGTDPKPLIAKEPAAQFEECMELEFPVELLEPLLFVLNRLLDQLCARLRMHVLSTSEIKVTLKLQKNDSRNNEPFFHIRTLRVPVATRDNRFLLKLLQLDLQAHPPGSPVTAVGILAVPAHGRTRQLGLFQPLSPEPERLQITLARIRSVVGEERVGQPQLLDTHRPNAFRQSPFVMPEITLTRSAKQHPTTTALRTYRPPLPAAVKLRDTKPTHIVCDGVKRQILAFAGPWRTKGDWWSDTAWARDEWDVLIPALRPKLQPDSAEAERQETALYRIYRDLQSRDWFVEGVYD